jgi:hypothetical protein
MQRQNLVFVSYPQGVQEILTNDDKFAAPSSDSKSDRSIASCSSSNLRPPPLVRNCPSYFYMILKRRCIDGTL